MAQMLFTDNENNARKKKFKNTRIKYKQQANASILNYDCETT